MNNILFNASTNVVGGGVKNAALFIKKARDNNEFNWCFAISPQVNDILVSWNIDTNINVFHVFKDSPSRSKSSRKRLLDLISNYNINLVYTMAGPAYVSFPCKHLLGISNPYITHADWSSFRLKGNLIAVFKYYAYVFVQFLYASRADYFVFQTNFSKNSFQKRTGIKKDRLFVVSNAFDTSIQNHFLNNSKINLNQDKEIRIFSPGAAYVHKGYQFLPNIVKELKSISNKKFKFILTLPHDSSIWIDIQNELKLNGLDSFVENIGPFKYTDIIALLSNSDIVFVPSLLETFSASYLEAMCAKKKLVVADKMYAKDVCANYASYINPMDAKKSAKTFMELFNNLKVSKEEEILADTILKSYGSQDDRAVKLIQLISEISKK